jgi:hypothetical protein
LEISTAHEALDDGSTELACASSYRNDSGHDFEEFGSPADFELLFMVDSLVFSKDEQPSSRRMCPIYTRAHQAR